MAREGGDKAAVSEVADMVARVNVGERVEVERAAVARVERRQRTARPSCTYESF